MNFCPVFSFARNLDARYRFSFAIHRQKLFEPVGVFVDQGIKTAYHFLRLIAENLLRPPVPVRVPSPHGRALSCRRRAFEYGLQPRVRSRQAPGLFSFSASSDQYSPPPRTVSALLISLTTGKLGAAARKYPAITSAVVTPAKVKANFFRRKQA